MGEPVSEIRPTVSDRCPNCDSARNITVQATASNGETWDMQECLEVGCQVRWCPGEVGWMAPLFLMEDG